MGNVEENHSATEYSRQIRDGQRSASKSNRLMIGNSSSIELFGWESSDFRVHSKLDSKHCFLVATIKKSLEKTSAVSCLF